MLAASYEHNIKATAGEEQAHESGKGRRIKRDQRRSDQIVADRSEEHTSELQSLMRISYAVFCLQKKTKSQTTNMLILYNTLLTTRVLTRMRRDMRCRNETRT